MPRAVTLFTGQWADLPVEALAERTASWGFDGLELACWGDHFDVAEALRDPAYTTGRRELLERHGLGVWAIGNHGLHRLPGLAHALLVPAQRLP
jgi:sugar phosphate isomerase/epimerase